MSDVSRGSPFGSRLKELRRQRDMSQRLLAEKAGIDFTYLSKLENGKAPPPSEDTIRKMAQHLEADANDLLARAGKIPTGVRERAGRSLIFARTLQEIARMTDDQLEKAVLQRKLPRRKPREQA